MSDKSYLQALQEAAFWSEYHRKRRDNPHSVTVVQTLTLSAAGGGYHPIWHSADTTTITGLGSGGSKWIGGVLGVDGKIYGIPHNSESVLMLSGGLPEFPLEPLLSPYLNKF